MIKRFDLGDLETREGESVGFQEEMKTTHGRHGWKTDCGHESNRKSAGPWGRYRGGQARAQEPTGSTEESPAGGQVRALRAMSGESRVLTSGGKFRTMVPNGDQGWR